MPNQDKKNKSKEKISKEDFFKLDLDEFIRVIKLSIWLNSAVGIAYCIVKQYRSYTAGDYMIVNEWFAAIFIIIYISTILYVAKRIKFLREQGNKSNNKK